MEGGLLPGAAVLKEHYRLGSSMVIISRSFCNLDKITDLEEVRRIFNTGIASIRRLEKEAETAKTYFNDNRELVVQSVHGIIEELKNNG